MIDWIRIKAYSIDDNEDEGDILQNLLKVLNQVRNNRELCFKKRSNLILVNYKVLVFSLLDHQDYIVIKNYKNISLLISINSFFVFKYI